MCQLCTGSLWKLVFVPGFARQEVDVVLNTDVLVPSCSILELEILRGRDIEMAADFRLEFGGFPPYLHLC